MTDQPKENTMNDTTDLVLSLLGALDDDALLATAFKLLDHDRVGEAIAAAREIDGQLA